MKWTGSYPSRTNTSIQIRIRSCQAIVGYWTETSRLTVARPPTNWSFFKNDGSIHPNHFVKSLLVSNWASYKGFSKFEKNSDGEIWCCLHLIQTHGLPIWKILSTLQVDSLRLSLFDHQSIKSIKYSQNSVFADFNWTSERLERKSWLVGKSNKSVGIEVQCWKGGLGTTEWRKRTGFWANPFQCQLT